jgi:hypothetical protein
MDQFLISVYTLKVCHIDGTSKSRSLQDRSNLFWVWGFGSTETLASSSLPRKIMDSTLSGGRVASAPKTCGLGAVRWQV